MKSLCIYCGSKNGNNEIYATQARLLGKICAEKKVRIIYGGAHVGLMGLIADACLENGGEVVGVMPKHLVDWEVAHTKLTDLKVVSSMHERKALMAELSDAFLALPGGYGTLDELFEITTWSQLGLHRKPIGLWNINSYFDHLIQFIQHSSQEGFVSEAHKNMIFHSENVEVLWQKLLPVSN
jgi:uncharacterized protein (TIGR00730 family)